MSTFGAGTYAAAPVAPALHYSGFWIRFIAYVIDVVILQIVLGIAMLVMGGGNAFGINPDTGAISGSFFGFMALSILLPALYMVGFWVNSGATPGKMLFGMHVVRADTGGPVTTGQAIGRFFSYFVSSVVFCLGFIWIGFDGRKQGWHDKLASTVVVRRHRSDVATFA